MLLRTCSCYQQLIGRTGASPPCRHFLSTWVLSTLKWMLSSKGLKNRIYKIYFDAMANLPQALPLKMSLTRKRKYSKSAFVIIRLLHEGLTHVHSQEKPRLHFGESFTSTLQQCKHHILVSKIQLTFQEEKKLLALQVTTLNIINYSLKLTVSSNLTLKWMCFQSGTPSITQRRLFNRSDLRGPQHQESTFTVWSVVQLSVEVSSDEAGHLKGKSDNSTHWSLFMGPVK